MSLRLVASAALVAAALSAAPASAASAEDACPLSCVVRSTVDELGPVCFKYPLPSICLT
jgi:hypothetical protein